MSVECLNQRLKKITNDFILNHVNPEQRYSALMQELVNYPDGFVLFHRLTIHQFSYIEGQIHFGLKDLQYSPGLCLSISLRYLSWDDKINVPLEAFGVSESDQTLILERVCDTIMSVFMPEVFSGLSQEEIIKMTESFDKMWNFPGCVGALEYRCIICRAPTDVGSRTLNAPIGFVCDPFYRFNACYIFDPLKTASSSVPPIKLQSYHFLANVIMTRFVVGNEQVFQSHGCVSVGSEESNLTSVQMRPYSTATQYHQQVFNYRLRIVSRVAENAIGILFERWRIFQLPILIRDHTLQRIVGCVVTLHNWLTTQDIAPGNSGKSYVPERFFVARDRFNNLDPGNWGVCSTTPGVTSLRNYFRCQWEDGIARRDEIAAHFCSSRGIQDNDLPPVCKMNGSR